MSNEGTAALTMGSLTPYDLQGEIVEAVELVRHHTMVPFPRLATTYQIAAHRDASHLPGAYVECGVWKGGVAGMMAIANLRHGRACRELHLFDSFSDVCEPDERIDGQRAVDEARQWGGVTGPLTGKLRSMTASTPRWAGRAALRRSKISCAGSSGTRWRTCRFTPVGSKTRSPRSTSDRSRCCASTAITTPGTRFCLSALYDEVVTGGFVILDDYGCYEGCRRAVDDFLAEHGITAFLHHVDAEGRCLVKP